MIYQLPPLPYAYNALEPYIDALTMEIHHTRHHGGYVSNLNKLLDGQPRFANRPLEEIVADISLLPEEIRQGVRNNGGGHLNHSLLWHSMGPAKGGPNTGASPNAAASEPEGILRHAINSTFGDFVKFRDELTRAAMARFGSGWAWLVLDHQGKMEVISTPNQDSPIMLGYRPVLGVDVWEHAYYLKYQNRRADYLAAWWNVVNWDKVAQRYAQGGGR